MGKKEWLAWLFGWDVHVAEEAGLRERFLLAVFFRFPPLAILVFSPLGLLASVTLTPGLALLSAALCLMSFVILGFFQWSSGRFRSKDDWLMLAAILQFLLALSLLAFAGLRDDALP
jgi:hypothetical protein